MNEKYGTDTPADVRPMRLQAAGHQFEIGRNLALLEEDDGKFVLKPVNKDHELSFYQRVFDSSCSDPIVLSLRRFVPKFYGIRCLRDKRDDTLTKYLKLENLTYGVDNASIMDVKIGRITSEPGASAEKKARENLKYAMTKIPLGFCITGMKIYNSQTGNHDAYDKKFGKSLNIITIKEVLRKFFGENHLKRKEITSLFLIELQKIYDWCLHQRVFNFYATSLLFVYSSSLKPVFSVRLVDFVHCLPSDLPDDNFLFGLRNLIESMNEIISE